MNARARRTETDFEVVPDVVTSFQDRNGTSATVPTASVDCSDVPKVLLDGLAAHAGFDDQSLRVLSTWLVSVRAFQEVQPVPLFLDEAQPYARQDRALIEGLLPASSSTTSKLAKALCPITRDRSAGLAMYFEPQRRQVPFAKILHERVHTELDGALDRLAESVMKNAESRWDHHRDEPLDGYVHELYVVAAILDSEAHLGFHDAIKAAAEELLEFRVEPTNSALWLLYRKLATGWMGRPGWDEILFVSDLAAACSDELITILGVKPELLPQRIGQILKPFVQKLKKKRRDPHESPRIRVKVNIRQLIGHLQGLYDVGSVKVQAQVVDVAPTSS